MTLGEALKGDIVVGAAGVEEEDGEVGKGAGEAGGEEGAGCAALRVVLVIEVVLLKREKGYRRR